MVNFPSTTAERKFRGGIGGKVGESLPRCEQVASFSTCIYPPSAKVDQEVAIKIFLTRGGTSEVSVEPRRSLIDRRLKDSKISRGGGGGGEAARKGQAVEQWRIITGR